MSTYTEHYNAKKPSKSENYDIDVANFNNDLWDEKIFEKQDKIVGKALSTNDFTNQYKNKLDSLKNYDDTEIKNNIEDIQIAQIKQDSNIQYLQTQNTKLKSENERLREDLKGLPTSTFSGEVIDLNDSSEMRFQEFKVFGNSKQKEEPSPLHPSEVESCGDNGNISFEIENDNKTNSQSYTIPIQKPFRKVGNYEDTFVKKNSKRYEGHWIKRLILDGSNKFVIGNPNNRFYLDINLNNLNYEAKSNYFKTGKENQFGVSETVVLQTNRINLMTSEFTNANDFNDWILAQYNAGNPVYIDYILAEPEDIECTDEQNKILDQIDNEAKTYKGVTRIHSNDKVSPKFEGTYNKDIEIMINNKATIVVESEV